MAELDKVVIRCLPLSRPSSEKPASHQLPFGLNRPLGQLGDVPSIELPEPSTPAKPKRKMSLVAGIIQSGTQNTQSVARHLTHTAPAKPVAHSFLLTLTNVKPIKQCTNINTGALLLLSACNIHWVSQALSLANYQYVVLTNMVHLPSCQHLPSTGTVFYNHQSCVFGGVVCQRFSCHNPKTQATVSHQHHQSNEQFGRFRHSQQTLSISASVPVPCRFYPLPEPPTPPEVKSCKPRPPSTHLPFALTRKSHTKQKLPASALPFALTCWHDVPVATTPNLRSYLVHNTISATIGGIAVEPLSFTIKTDMSSLYWQGQLDITAKDFAKIKAKLDVARGNEPAITVNINSTNFVIIAEEVSKTRQFANHTYSLSGRSPTARLSAEYASSTPEMIEQSLYASQIVNNALANLPFACEFSVADWLIPSGSYATGDKTPIAIIDDIAKACGGFVLSDKADSQLSIKPKYKKAAWELASATPDVTVPLDVIRQISQQKQSNPRYNTIVLTSSNQGAIVYREREGRGKEAPSQNNALYTDQACIIPAGIAQLSDSGIHEQVSIVMRWADKYNLALASLGDIWQVNDKTADGTDDAWRAIVQSVALDVRVDDGVPVIWQTVGLDRYLDI